jgi:hypothetical protein
MNGRKTRSCSGPAATPRTVRPDRRTSDVGTLSPAQREFCLEYLRNGFNATAAYKAAYRGVVDATARSNGWRLLTNADILAFLAPHMERRWKRLQIGGDEALARIAMDARLDPRLFFDERGKPLKPHDWPDAVAGSVKAIEFRKDGGTKLTFVDGLSARRMILEQTGKLKAVGGTFDALAEAIRADKERHGAQ